VFWQENIRNFSVFLFSSQFAAECRRGVLLSFPFFPQAMQEIQAA